MGILLSTNPLSAGDRLDYWNEYVRSTYAPCLGTVRDNRVFNARGEVLGFGAAQVSDVASTGIQYERRSCGLRRDTQIDIPISLISARTLNRRFSQVGGTLNGWLQAQHLAKAYDALAQKAARNVTGYNFYHDFNHLSDYSQAPKSVTAVLPIRYCTKRAGSLYT